MPKILITAGEVSGDMHAAHLVRALNAQNSDLTFVGLGGKHMKEAGVDIRMDITQTSTIGLVEPLVHLPRLMKAFKMIETIIEEEKPDLYIPVDAQGFHLYILNKLKNHAFPKIYYISPQEWHWGTEEGGKKVIDVVDKMISIFPQEETFYNRLGGNAVYVGHPLIDIVGDHCDRATFIKKNNLNDHQRMVAVFPGSRQQEIKRTAPVLIKAAKRLKDQNQGLQILISCVEESYKQKIRTLCDRCGFKKTDYQLYDGHSRDLVHHVDLSIVSSGTISLEHAFAGTPCIVAYRLHPLTYILAHIFFTEKVKKIVYFSLPNIIMNEAVVPEFRQHEATPEALCDSAQYYLNNPEAYAAFKEKLAMVKEKCGSLGVLERAAKEILVTLESK